MDYTYQNIPVSKIKPYAANARSHSNKQLRKLANVIETCGFSAPVLLDEHYVLIAGHARLAAAKLLGMKTIPAVVITGLTSVQKRALRLADNRIPEDAKWISEQLAVELPQVIELLSEAGLDPNVIGFEPAEIELIQTNFEEKSADPADEVSPGALAGPLTTAPGDLWLLGKHRLLCGDAKSSDDVAQLLGGERAHTAFLDVPYNVRVRDIGSRGRVKHREFAEASGEMTSEQYIKFLRAAASTAVKFSVGGAVHFICIDWRHVDQLISASRSTYDSMLNLVVWVKPNAGMGSFYRSQHELIGVFRVGGAPHLNTIELGRHGRNRTNVWHYAGANSFGKSRKDDLRAHPTVKPIAMIADAMKDCTRRNDIVLDTFCGSGSTLMAAERVGRRGYGLEIDPVYVDVAVRRWQSFTGLDARHAISGLTFDEVGDQRSRPPASAPRARARRDIGRA